MSHEEGETTESSLRHHPGSPLEDDDLLSEILLRLPPLPSSLPRASAVCRRWRLLVSDRGFSRRFRHHHRRGHPIIGVYNTTLHHHRSLYFVPTLKAPNRVPSGRLSLHPQRDDQNLSILGCRHGLVLVRIWHAEPPKRHVMVWDSISGEQHRPGMPPGFDTGRTFNGAVLRGGAAGDNVVDDHFQVVLIGNGDQQRAVASVYSSETGLWSDLVSSSTPLPRLSPPEPLLPWSFDGISPTPAVLIGSSLYWLLGANSFGILRFDLETRSLGVIGLPVRLGPGSSIGSYGHISITRAEDDGALGFLYLSGYIAQLWKRKTQDDDGVASSWVLDKTIDLNKLLSLNSKMKGEAKVMGFAEDNNMVFVRAIFGTFAIYLDSLQFNKLPGFISGSYYYPFQSVWCM